MKHDLNALETDDVNTPPFITRSTVAKDNDRRLKEFESMSPIFKALRAQMKVLELVE